MKTNRKWIVLVSALVLMLVFAACSGKKKKMDTGPVVQPPPAPSVTTPGDDMSGTQAIATGDDPTEAVPPRNITELQADAESRGLLGDVFYDFDRYELRPEARERLARNAEFMNSEGQGLSFNIEGHCDERGTNEYNIALGERRSNAALDYLVSLGVAASRFRTISYGEERPFCTESTEACWQKNRRARFVITGSR